jgi:transcriptional regulator with XRE-family HTH domain
MNFAIDHQQTTGLDLKLARVARGVSQRAIARQLGVSPQRISGIEATYRPTAQICGRYSSALVAITGVEPERSQSAALEAAAAEGRAR